MMPLVTPVIRVTQSQVDLSGPVIRRRLRRRRKRQVILPTNNNHHTQIHKLTIGPS